MKTRKLTLGALFVALGLVLPIAFHAIGLGQPFLPMHIPVLLAGFMIGPVLGGIAGFVTPLLSAFLTGMPPLMPPIALLMAFELAGYAVIIGVLYRRLSVVSLLAAMVGGRLIYGLLGAVLLPLFGFEGISVFYPITLGLVSQIPGIIVQLVLIPPLMVLIPKSRLVSEVK